MKRAPFVFLAAAVVSWCLGPFLWQIVTSLKPDADLTRLPPFLPSVPTLDHYAAVLSSDQFLRVIVNSALAASSSTLLSLALGSFAAFGLAKLQVRFTRTILLFVLSASMFPPIATISPLYLVIRTLGLRDSLWSLIITYTTFTLPLTIWVLTHFFRRIPDDIYRASRVDGCSPFRSFLIIMFPLAAPGIVTAGILAFIFSWNEFLFALTFTATEASRTVPVAIALFPGMHEVPWGDIAAASIVVTLPLIALVIVFQQRIVEGLTAGAVKE